MTHQRFNRLLTPGSILGFSLTSGGVILGMLYGLNDLYHKISADYEVPLEEWGRFQGDVWALLPSILITTLVFYALSVVIAPDQSDRAALRRIARSKLSQPLLSEQELEMWSRLMEEVKHHD
ncbi:MAG: hypothetical protein SFY66_10755 [Oculatellaceae cyanobacterium bins.114]|nr:hypothetical protein [Oculatellaceae cyanobacterium bins.114]